MIYWKHEQQFVVETPSTTVSVTMETFPSLRILNTLSKAEKREL